MTPTPQADLEWATGPHPFALDWCDAPGTAKDDGITPAQYEAGRLLRASRINPTWNVDVAPHKKRGRKRGGHPPRPTRVVNGVHEIWCTGCQGFHPVTEFYRRLNAFQPSCKRHQASQGGQQWRVWHAAKEAAIAKREADEAA